MRFYGATVVDQGIWLGPGGWLYDYNPLRVGTGGGPYLAIVFNPTTRSSNVVEVTNQATKSKILTELSQKGEKVSAAQAKALRASGTKTSTTTQAASPAYSTPSGPAGGTSLAPGDPGYSSGFSLSTLPDQPWFWPVVVFGTASLIAGGILLWGGKK